MLYCLRYLVVLSRGVMGCPLLLSEAARFLLFLSPEYGRMWAKGGDSVFTYIVEKGANLKIHTPGIKDLSQIKTKTIQKADCIYMQSDYPGGWHIEVEQRSDRIVIYSNYQLTQNEDGSFNAPTELSGL